MAIAASQAGDRQPEHSFLQSTRAFCRLLYEIGNEETRAAAFLFENTYCYQEFDGYKRISLDEFVHGRKRVNGTRFTDGCNISKRNNAQRGLNKLETCGHAESKIEGDKGRQMKYYRLLLPSLDQTVIESDNTPPVNVIEFDNSGKHKAIKKAVPVIESDNTCYPNGEQTVIESDNSIRVSTKKELKESTSKTPEPTAELASIAPSARTSDDVPLWSQEMFSEQRKRLRTLLQQVRDLRHAGAPASDYLPLQAQADTLEATITHQTDLLLSDSQGPGNASGGGLHENAQAAEQADQQPEDMFTAVAHALGFTDTKRMNDSARNTVGKAKKEFEQVGVKPGQVDTVVRSYRASNRNFNIWAFLSELPKYATAALGGA